MDPVLLTRKEVVALAAAALAVPWAEPAGAARSRKRRVPSIHCLPPADRFAPAAVLADCSFAAWSPDGATLACTTPNGVELRPRAGGAPRGIAEPGFRLGSQPWHPSGGFLLLTGPAGGVGPAETAFAVRADGSGRTRLLEDLPGRSRAAAFSPDGARVALTYEDEFVQRMLIADFASGARPGIRGRRVLLPFDPRGEQSAARTMQGLAWYETRGFTPDGRGLVFASDRGSGMVNAGVYVLDLESGAIRHVTRDDGFAEGTALDPSGGTLYYGSTRAREPAFLTLITGPQVPPFLGFAAVPALHDTFVRGGWAPISNGDVLAADARTGLRARIVARREVVARAAGLGPPDTEHRVSVCSMSPDGRELAVAVAASGRSAVVIMRRGTSAAAVAPGPSPTPPGTTGLAGPAPLAGLAPSAPVLRTLEGRFGGALELSLSGTPHAGRFEAVFRDFTDDGVVAYTGRVMFETSGGNLTHEADLRRLRGSEAGEEDAGDRGYYRADIRIDGGGARGNMEGRSARSGAIRAEASGGAFVPQGRWTAGRRAPVGVAGAERCRRRRRRRTR